MTRPAPQPQPRIRPRHRARRLRAALAFGGMAFGVMFGAQAQAVAAAQARRQPVEAHAARWQASLDAFSAEDRAHAPAAGGVLFLGSSSIRLWAGLERSFDAVPVVVKRGFGGSRLSDCAQLVERLVWPYKPRLIVLYAGDNDLAEGATPEQVLASFVEFVQATRVELPDTRIAYLSIKPSPLRAALMPAATQANALIRAYSETLPNLDYIDVYSKMLDAQGRPRAELFGPDALHLSAAGYALWRAEVASHLSR